MVTDHVREIARELEALGRQKIRLAEIILKRELSNEEKDELYVAAMRDQFCLIFEACPNISLQDLYMALQMEEMLSEENIYHAGNKLRRQPTDAEIKSHYIECGRPSTFNAIFKKLVPEYLPR